MDLISLPKVVNFIQELHAHLNGCVRRETLIEFLQEKGKEYEFPNAKNIADAFHIFSLVHSVITTPEKLLRILLETLEDFEKQNCVYLELRTTPKATPFMNKNQY